MPRTSPKVGFGLFALALKQGASFSAADKQTFSKTDDLKTGNVGSKPYASFEPNFWLLDGSYKFKPENDSLVHVGLMSLSMSDVDGNFDIPPVLTITFDNIQSSDGITIRFSSYTNDYANDIDIAYYDSSDDLIRTDNYIPTGPEFSSGQAVSDFQKITITFNATNKPYRYLRVMGVDFGELVYFTGADIQAAEVVQEVNPLSLELPIDTLDLRLYSTNADFSIINPTGSYAKLKEKQPLDVYEIVNGGEVYIGQFYLSKWKNPANNIIVFSATDRLGILDEQSYMGGIWLSPVSALDLIDVILTSANSAYELDADLMDEQIRGWLPICSYREALQQIAFAIGARVTCSRTGVIRIQKTVLASDLDAFEYTITKADKGIQQELTLLPLVTDIEVATHNYFQSGNQVTLFNGTLATGQHTIKFNSPIYNLGASGATIVSHGVNHAVVNVTVAGMVTVTGYEYKDTQSIASVRNNSLDPTVPRNILQITDATLVHSGNGATIAQRVYDYYQQRYKQDVKLYAPSAEPGASVLIDTLYNRKIGGIVEKMELDLARGYTSKTTIVGVVE